MALKDMEGTLCGFPFLINKEDPKMEKIVQDRRKEIAAVITHVAFYAGLTGQAARGYIKA